MTKVYLDIDGVLLANDLNAAKHVHEFLEKVTGNYDTYWLTTHCQGDASTAYDRLSLVLEPRTMELLNNIKATKWEVAKTEAIDFKHPFLWFDDDLYDDEKEELLKHDALESWIEVDLAKDEDYLAKFISSFPISKRV
jgi:hypothetical protein